MFRYDCPLRITPDNKHVIHSAGHFTAFKFQKLVSVMPDFLHHVETYKILNFSRVFTDKAVLEFCEVHEPFLYGMECTYLFSHTTNRIDVQLGSNLYKHLTQLPIAYFGARRVGETVARVRELDRVRNFLTGSALTLVLDLAFTVVFFAVMFSYAPLLTWIVVASLPFYIGLTRTAAVGHVS